MDRVLRAGQFALYFAIALSLPSIGGRTLPPVAANIIATPVPWATSSLLVSEVMTGGASASDEFVELTNAGMDPVDLSGYELVYATSSGGTVTRKAAWTTPTIIGPGRHLLVANLSGVHAAIADATYSGGLASTCGAVALRSIGGAVVDAVGWGDAANAFVEGLAFLLDDGTAVGRIALQGVAAEYLPLLEPGDALNASGRVLKDGAGYQIVVDDAANLVRVGDPTLDPAPSVENVAQPAVRDPNVAAPARRLAAGPLGPGLPGTAGILGFVLILVASVAITLFRRRRARHILAARVAVRLAEVGATHGPD